MELELIEIIKIVLLIGLIVTAICAAVLKRTLHAVIAFTGYSLIMAIVWVLLESPDLAVTEAAVGAGVSGVFFYIALRKIGRMEAENDKNLKNGLMNTENGSEEALKNEESER